MFIELISFGYVHNEAEEGHNRPPVADITIDLRPYTQDVTDIGALAGAFAGNSPRPVTVAIGSETGQHSAPAFVAALSGQLTDAGHTTNIHHRDLALATA
ncbi:hypothetical protein OG784_12890 [Streptomyces sp. NBC_01617]|uniref:hypothetical protein n=1 Tax=Streptomyces sp. NBC_01617 TaxID=2975899 RepID=UPI00386D3B16|nr:hypothetical protein OG784_12890 [Streptomyces sp. NBC_01617]